LGFRACTEQIEIAGKCGAAGNTRAYLEPGKEDGDTNAKKPEREAAMEKGNVCTVKIEDMSSEGQGIGRAEGLVVFVPGAVVGDTVKIQLTKVKKNYAFSKMLEILEPSADRIEDFDCTYFQAGCGGCAYGRMDYPAQVRLKQKQVTEKLQRLAGLEAPVIRPIIRMEDTDNEGNGPFRYRNKAQFPVSTGGIITRKGGIVENLGEPAVGFFRAKSHEVVDCEDCYLQSLPAMAAADALRRFMEEDHITAWDPRWEKGLLRHLIVKTGFMTGEVMVVLVINGKGIPNAQKLIEMLDDAIYEVGYSLESVVINVNQKKDGAKDGVLGDENIVIAGKPVIRDEIGELVFEISPSSFYQVNPVQMKRLYDVVKAYCQQSITADRSSVSAASEDSAAGDCKKKSEESERIECIEDGRKKGDRGECTECAEEGCGNDFKEEVIVKACASEEVIPGIAGQGNIAGKSVMVMEPNADDGTGVNAKTAENAKAGYGRKPVILDLYCGVGTIGLYCADIARGVVGIERVREAVVDANRNAVINGIVNARYICGCAEDVLPKYVGAGTRTESLQAAAVNDAAGNSDAVETPDSSNRSGGHTVPKHVAGTAHGGTAVDADVAAMIADAEIAILDPPRAGCKPELLQAVAAAGIERIVYVSCDPATLARDVKLLGELGYEFVEATPVDMFPWTVHVECVTLLQKSNRKRKPDTHVKFSLNMEDYYRIKDAEGDVKIE